MQALDIVVHASTKPEPFGMVVIEAMACQRPVIVSAAGGAMEIFAEGKTGLGHKPGDAGDLARQMQRLLEDEALRQSLGRAGSQHVRENFSRERLAGQLIDCYTRMRGKR